MELSKLCEKIINDATEKAQEITNEAQKKSLELINSEKEKSIIKSNEIRDKAPLLAKEEYSRLISSAKLNCQRKILQKKRELINEAFNNAYLKLINMTSTEYKNFISQRLKNINEKAQIEIAKKYSKDIDNKFLKSINSCFSLSNTYVERGFNIVMDKSAISYDFKEVIENIISNEDSRISQIIFSEE